MAGIDPGLLVLTQLKNSLVHRLLREGNAVGARPLHIFSLLVLEAVSLTLAGIALGLALLYAGIAAAKPWLEQQYGLFLPLAWPTPSELKLLGGILAASLLMGCIPAWRAYRQALLDGLSIRL